MSGNRSYGKRNPRYCRIMKSVFKTAALSAISGNNQFGELYRYLIDEKKYPEHQARHAVSRRVATITLGVLKSGNKFEPYRKRKDVKINKISS